MNNPMLIDTHAHLDGNEYQNDLHDVIQRAKQSGVGKIFIPAIDLDNLPHLIDVCRQYPGYLYPMIGLHPEEVRNDWPQVLNTMKQILADNLANAHKTQFIAIGEVGLDFYWSREFEQQQLEAFEEQVAWAAEFQLPLMIHCRKAQHELVRILRKYETQLPGGVFHCFTGNDKEAAELLTFNRFVLGIGGVATFKSSLLREMLPAHVPLNRIVLETDSPYMTPVPHRGKRNESAYIGLILNQLAECYKVTAEAFANQTNENVRRIFGIS